jgi:hypothetical protein
MNFVLSTDYVFLPDFSLPSKWFQQSHASNFGNNAPEWQMGLNIGMAT